jgi:hypothetical protein
MRGWRDDKGAHVTTIWLSVLLAWAPKGAVGLPPRKPS